MLSVVTSSTDDQYTTTSAVKDLIGTTATSDDALINTLISRASRWAESYIGYPLGVASYRESLSGYGGRRMMLSRHPVRGVASFWNATDTGSATTILSSEFRVDYEAGFVDRDAGFAWDAPVIPGTFAVSLDAHFWAGEEYPDWLVDYKAGYTYAGISTGSGNWTTAGGTTSTGRSLPEDIEEAVRYRAAAIYEGMQGVTARKVGPLSIQYATGADGNTIDPAEELLAPYRSVV